jgi:hypothetical protein
MIRIASRPTFVVLVLLVLPVACATIGGEGAGDRDLPTSGVGPFRKLETGEVPGTAPFVLDDKLAEYRDPSALLAPDGSVILHAVARDKAGADVIVRTRAPDAVSFHGTREDSGHTPRVVLAPALPWEGPALSGPSALLRGGETWLYYAGTGGIGLARSTDGFTFTREPSPVLTAATPPVAWETTAPRAPSVIVLPGGELRMFYAAGNSIGEARSTDGVRFERVGTTPVLAPRPPSDVPLQKGEKPAFDRGAVADPFASVRITPAGRLHVRVLYTGYAAAPGASDSAIGFAARYGDTGPLEANALAVYAVGRGERAPVFVEIGRRSFLYVEQDVVTLGTDPKRRALAAGVAPVSEILESPRGFPAEP